MPDTTPSPAPQMRSETLIDSVKSDYSMSGSTFDVYFAPSGYNSWDGVRSNGWNAYEIQQFQSVFDTIATVIDVNFNITNSSSGAEYVMILDTDETAEYDNALGYFYLPTSNQSIGVFNATLWDRTSGGDLEAGGYSYVTMVHEMLHGLGLGHPHDTGGGTGIMAGVGAAFDDFGNNNFNQGIYTTMTYNSGFHAGANGTVGDTGWDWGYESGPMALDIAALQDLYGANTTHASGNNTYVLPASNVSGTQWQSIWDTGGVDTLRHNGSTNAVIDLRAATLNNEAGGLGFVSNAAGVAGGFTVANGVSIENAITGSGNDTVTGNGASNNIELSAGNDSAQGNAGHDTIDGGSGHDTLRGGTGGDNLLGGVGNDSLFGDSSVDELHGGTGKDTMAGGTGADTLHGDAGDDRLFGNTGVDLIYGGDGGDWISSGNGVDVVYGEDGDDYIIGRTGWDTLYGGDGDDSLLGSEGQDDLYGGNGNDYLSGATGSDYISGGAGNDTIYSSQGHDTIDAGTGNDEIYGGSLIDTFIFAAGHGHDTIGDFEGRHDILELSSALVGSATTGQQVLNTYGTVTDTNVFLDFGGGNTIDITIYLGLDTITDNIQIV